MGSAATITGIVGGAFLVLSFCMCFCIFYKFRRPKRRRQTGEEASDGLFTDSVKNVVAMTGYHDQVEDVESSDQQLQQVQPPPPSSFPTISVDTTTAATSSSDRDSSSRSTEEIADASGF